MGSKSQYAFWLGDRKLAYNKSLIGHYFKRKPKQICNKEIIILKNYMNNPKYKRWCIRFILRKALRGSAVSMAESISFKFARKLGYSQTRKPDKNNAKNIRL